MAEKKPVPKEQKIMLGIIAVVGLFFFYKRAWLPQGKEIKDLRKKIEDTRKSIEDTKVKIAQMSQLEAEFESLKGEVLEAEKKLPREEDLPGLIKKITDIAKKYNADVENFRIGNITERQYYKEHTYTFPFSNSYHKIAQFFVDICQEERIMTVRDVTLNPGESPDEIDASFTLIVYTYKG